MEATILRLGLPFVVRFDEQDADLFASANILDDGYAVTSCRAKRKLHRLVAERMLGRPLSRHEIVDHVNSDRLDCRRANLRLTDKLGNGQHRKGANRNSATGIRGVVRASDGKAWRAIVVSSRRGRVERRFADIQEAAAWVAAKRREFGFLGETDA
jgi:hypothetical protein